MNDPQDVLGALLKAPYGDATTDAFLRHLGSPRELAAFVDFVVRNLLTRDHHSVFWGDRMLTIDKSMGFLDDPRFASVWKSVRGAHEYDQYDNRQSIAWRMHTLVWAARNALALPEGDFVECGVFQGDMSFVVHQAAGISGSGRRMHLFDSFEGIDPARAVEGEYAFSSNYVENSNRHYSRHGLYESVVERFAAFPEVAIHRGFLPETLIGNAPDRIAWLHIDLNAALPEVQTLDYLFDRVVPSGFVILDDYGWLVLDAQKKAEDAFFAERGYTVLELPTGQGLVVKRPGVTTRGISLPNSDAGSRMSEVVDLDRYANVFDPLTPWSGTVPGATSVDFLGIVTEHRFLPLTAFPETDAVSREVLTRLPVIEDGEIWFEAVNWLEAARAAEGSYVMVTLGANYGAQAVGAAVALRALNDLPFRLVAVEPVPENYEWTKVHMRANGIDPDEQWLIKAAISEKNDPVLFPVGSPGSGAQNSFSTNEIAARRSYARDLAHPDLAAKALANLLVHNTTGLIKNLVQGFDLPAEIKLVSAVTLADILSPFDVVDYIESDIQQSEILVFPPFMDVLRRKVRRIHIGTHGAEVHRTLRDLFVENGWEVVFDFAPNSSFESSLGPFQTNDGVLTLRNPTVPVRHR